MIWFFNSGRQRRNKQEEVAVAWNTIAENTLTGDDLAKFMSHLDADD